MDASYKESIIWGRIIWGCIIWGCIIWGCIIWGRNIWGIVGDLDLGASAFYSLDAYPG
jgi:hypothetical protein